MRVAEVKVGEGDSLRRGRPATKKKRCEGNDDGLSMDRLACIRWQQTV